MLPERKDNIVPGSVASVAGLCLAMTNIDLKDSFRDQSHAAESLSGAASLKSESGKTLKPVRSLPVISDGRRRSQSNGETKSYERRRRQSYDVSVVESKRRSQSLDETGSRQGQKYKVGDSSYLRERRISHDVSTLTRIDEDIKRKEMKESEEFVVTKDQKSLKKLRRFSTGKHVLNLTTNLDKIDTTQILQMRQIKNGFFDLPFYKQKKTESNEIPAENVQTDTLNGRSSSSFQNYQRQFSGDIASARVDSTVSQDPARWNTHEETRSKEASLRQPASGPFRPQITRTRSSLESLSVAPQNILFDLNDISDDKVSRKLSLDCNYQHGNNQSNTKGITNRRSLDEVKTLGESMFDRTASLLHGPIQKRPSFERLPPTRKISSESINSAMGPVDLTLVTKIEEVIKRPEFLKRKTSFERLTKIDGKLTTRDIHEENHQFPSKMLSFSNGSSGQPPFTSQEGSSVRQQLLRRKLSLDRLNSYSFARNEIININQSTNPIGISKNTISDGRNNRSHGKVQNEEKNSIRSNEINLLHASHEENPRDLAAVNDSIDVTKRKTFCKGRPEGGKKSVEPKKDFVKVKEKSSEEMKINNEVTGIKTNPLKKKKFAPKDVLGKKFVYNESDYESYSDNEKWNDVKIVMKSEKTKGIIKSKRRGKNKNVTFNRKVTKKIVHCM